MAEMKVWQPVVWCVFLRELVHGHPCHGRPCHGNPWHGNPFTHAGAGAPRHARTAQLVVSLKHVGLTQNARATSRYMVAAQQRLQARPGVYFRGIGSLFKSVDVQVSE